MFFVIDQQNGTSWSDKTEQGESFKTERAAMKRAQELACDAPGETFLVVKAIKAVRCPIGAPAIKTVA